MWWLWFVGPLVAALLYAINDLTWRDRRRDQEIERWREASRGRGEDRLEGVGYRGVKKTETAIGPKRVTSMPGPLARMLATTGGGNGGVRLDTFALVPKLAYLAVMGSDLMQGSDHTTIVAKLDEGGPSFTVRPLPILEGQRVPNTGVQFKKDGEFMALFLVERSLVEGGAPPPVSEAEDRAIRKWLSPPLREALFEFPDGWLRIDGKAKIMALTLYGPADAQKIRDLVAAADIVFAEYGADGGPSLLGEEEEEEAAPPPPPKKKVKSAGAKSADR